MTERMMPQQHRARSRDRSDQRRPTFQVLNATQPRTHTHGKRDFNHYIEDLTSHYPHPPEEMNEFPPSSPHHHVQKRPICVHTIGNKSYESVTSGRGPACNFANDTCPIGNNNSEVKNRSQSASPGGRPRSLSPQDRVVMEEPSDLVVWNPSKKTSRSNILCPLTDSEFRNINVMDTKTILRAPRARSNSVPVDHQHRKSKHHQTHSPGQLQFETRNIVLYNEDGENLYTETPELLDEFAPPPMSPSQISPSASTASTNYSLQVSLVTQQLEEIQLAQNDVLKHLGEEISKVTDENERLNKELDQTRGQKESLQKLLHDTMDELERLKQIFRMRALSHPQAEFNKQEGNPEIVVHPPSSGGLPQHQQQRISRRSNKQQRHGGKRDSVNSNSSNKKSSLGDGDPAIAHLLNNGGENSYATDQPAQMASSSKQTKGKKLERSKQQHLIQQNIEHIDVQHRSEEMLLDTEADEITNDDNASYRSTESHAHVKGSTRRRSSDRDRSHRHGHHHTHANSHNHNTNEQRGRSRSKERHPKSPRSSNYYEQQQGKKMRAVHQEDECNDEIEIQQSEGGGGCFRVFTCCWSSSSSRARTDSVDDMVLRECSERK